MKTFVEIGFNSEEKVKEFKKHFPEADLMGIKTLEDVMGGNFSFTTFLDEKEIKKFKKHFPKSKCIEATQGKDSLLQNMFYYSLFPEFNSIFSELVSFEDYSLWLKEITNTEEPTEKETPPKLKDLADSIFESYSDYTKELIGCHQGLRGKLFEKMKDDKSTMEQITLIRNKLNLIEQAMDNIGVSDLLEESFSENSQKNKSGIRVG